MHNVIQRETMPILRINGNAGTYPAPPMSAARLYTSSIESSIAILTAYIAGLHHISVRGGVDEE